MHPYACFLSSPFYSLFFLISSHLISSHSQHKSLQDSQDLSHIISFKVATQNLVTISHESQHRAHNRIYNNKFARNTLVIISFVCHFQSHPCDVSALDPVGALAPDASHRGHCRQGPYRALPPWLPAGGHVRPHLRAPIGIIS
jgi:hypothetical protein